MGANSQPPLRRLREESITSVLVLRPRRQIPSLRRLTIAKSKNLMCNQTSPNSPPKHQRNIVPIARRTIPLPNRSPSNNRLNNSRLNSNRLNSSRLNSSRLPSIRSKSPRRPRNKIRRPQRPRPKVHRLEKHPTRRRMRTKSREPRQNGGGTGRRKRGRVSPHRLASGDVGK